MLALGLGWGDGFMAHADFSFSWRARRKGETHGCISLAIILCGKPPAMRFDDRLTDAWPDPHALLFGREERFEQAR
jgi:hypothetical protein